MILIDYSSLAITAVMGKLKAAGKDIDMNFVRTVVLDSIRKYNMRFKGGYGDMVICCDAPVSWRKAVYPHYKFKRKTARKKSSINWQELFEHINNLANELDEHFPYMVLKVEEAEADDIIAELTRIDDENHIIVSSDLDFTQLHSTRIAQYSPSQDKMVIEKDPKRKLKEHIIKGDSSDCIPNIISEEDCLVQGIRQKSIYQADLDRWTQEMLITIPSMDDRIIPSRFEQNVTLICLDRIPKDIKDKIRTDFDYYKANGNMGRGKLMKYFTSRKLKGLLPHIGEF